MAKFRHKCPPDVNPKYSQSDPRHAEYGIDQYREHIRRVYETPEDTVWVPIMESDSREARLGISRPTGRVMAVVRCPDCGTEVVVATEA